MNEIIKELFQQAGGSVEVCDVTQDEVLTYTEFLNPEKFAELIIRRCMNICEYAGDKGQDGHYCVDNIKKHFGIK